VAKEVLGRWWSPIARALGMKIYAHEKIPVKKVGIDVGDYVRKVGGDYAFSGWVVAKFPKKSGAVRYVVENPAGILHIYSEKNLADWRMEDSGP
jgi:hypothetical protein